MANGLRTPEEEELLRSIAPQPITPLQSATNTLVGQTQTPFRQATGINKPLLRTPLAKTADVFARPFSAAEDPARKEIMQTKFGTVEGSPQQLRRVAAFEQTGKSTAELRQQDAMRRGELIRARAAEAGGIATDKLRSARQLEEARQAVPASAKLFTPTESLKQGVNAPSSRITQWAVNNAVKSEVAAATSDVIERLNSVIGEAGETVLQGMNEAERKSATKILNQMRGAGESLRKGSIAQKKIDRLNTIIGRAQSRVQKKLGEATRQLEKKQIKEDRAFEVAERNRKVLGNAAKRELDLKKFEKSVADTAKANRAKGIKAKIDMVETKLVTESDDDIRFTLNKSLENLTGDLVKLYEKEGFKAGFEEGAEAGVEVAEDQAPLVTTKAQFDALPSGTRYKTSSGAISRKP